MRELIGTCNSCGKEVFCENGFFNGSQANGKLLCNDCTNEVIRDEKKAEN